MQRMIQVTAMLSMIHLALVGCKKSDEAVFLQYYNLAVRDMDREIEMLRKLEPKHIVKEIVLQNLEGDIRHLESKIIRFYNKPQLHKELDAKRDQIIETRIASLKNKDNELPR